MLVTIRTISGPSFTVEAAETETVAQLKEKVVSTAPEGVAFVKDALLLIHKGKILNDAETLKDANIEEGSFCVAMQRKSPATKEAKPAAVIGQPSTAPAVEPPAEMPVETGQEETPAVPQESTAAVPAAEEQPAAEHGTYEEAASTLSTGTQLEENINQICEMGFERSQVVRAMHAAFNNPDRAVEYLMNGIPQMEAAPPAQQPPATGTPQAVGGTPVTSVPPAEGQGQGQPQGQGQGQPQGQGQGPNTQPLNMFGGSTGGGGGTGGRATGGSGALDFLRTNPRFNLLRHLVAHNPEVLQPMMQELGRTNPELLRQINEHQQEFLALLTEEPAQVTEAAEGLMQLAGQGDVAGGDPAVPTLTITQEEAEAIERLQSLGFDRDRCVEAFFICDKNEEIAANYLLEHADDA